VKLNLKTLLRVVSEESFIITSVSMEVRILTLLGSIETLILFLQYQNGLTNMQFLHRHLMGRLSIEMLDAWMNSVMP